MSDDKVVTDDALAIWMALITERERLDLIVQSRCNGSKALTDEEVAGVERTLVRMKELVEIAHQRRHQVREVFAGVPKTSDELVQEQLMLWKERSV